MRHLISLLILIICIANFGIIGGLAAYIMIGLAFSAITYTVVFTYALLQ